RRGWRSFLRWGLNRLRRAGERPEDDGTGDRAAQGDDGRFLPHPGINGGKWRRVRSPEEKIRRAASLRTPRRTIAASRRLPGRRPLDTKDIGYRCCLPALAGFTALKFQRSPGSTPRTRALCTPDALGEAVDPSEAG